MSKYVSPPHASDWDSIETQKWVEGLTRRIGVAKQADSTASTVADLVTDFNSLLAILQSNGFMEK